MFDNFKTYVDFIDNEPSKKMQLNFVNCKPFIKWVGGKSSVSDVIMAEFPHTYKKYHEPFLGGGAIFFAMKFVDIKDNDKTLSVLSDINGELINTYLIVQKEPGKVISCLNYLCKLLANCNILGVDDSVESFYYTIRDVASGTALYKAVRFIFLNKTCFNGLYRENKSGLFNSPFGKRKFVFDANAIVSCSSALQYADIARLSFADINPCSGDLVYADPPYVKRDDKSFTGFSGSGFALEDHIKLANVTKKWANNNVFVMISNADTSQTREIYKDFKIIGIKDVISRVGGSGERRLPTSDVLIKSW